MFSLDPAKLDQVPAAPLLLSHVTVLNALVCDFLPGLQSWAGLLRVPTNPLQRRTFHSIGSTHGEPATRWSVRVRHVECGGTVGQLGGFAGETAHAQWLTGRLPGGVCATVNRIFVPLMPSLTSTFCPTFLLCRTSQYLRGVTEPWESLAQLGMLGIYRELTSPHGRHHGPSWCLGTELCLLRGGAIQEKGNGSSCVL